MNKKIASAINTRHIIQQHNFSFKKKFGQNFLIDEFILDEIVEGANLNEEDCVLEIGPGIGSLTQVLAETVKNVLAVEIDRSLIPVLNQTLEDYDNIEVVNADILKFDLAAYVKKNWNDQPIKVVANLPYYITTPIIMMLFERNIPLKSITVMVQKEVGDRMQAGPGTKDYGALSLAVQYYSNPRIVTDVPPSSFIPQPKVGSTVICLERVEERSKLVRDQKWLFRIIRSAFQQRRKTLVNTLHHQKDLNLEKAEIKSILEEMDLSLTIRGEALTLERFIDLSNRLYDLKNV